MLGKKNTEDTKNDIYRGRTRNQKNRKNFITLVKSAAQNEDDSKTYKTFKACALCICTTNKKRLDTYGLFCARGIEHHQRLAKAEAELVGWRGGDEVGGGQNEKNVSAQVEEHNFLRLAKRKIYRNIL